MCGIVGWVDRERDLTSQGDLLNRMAEHLNRRGPDAKGIWLSEHAAFAHRRLIVIDPECGLQPMRYQTGDYTYAITYNGEIYNFQELRAELESRGHTFETHSDTEVLLHAYLEWGEDCVKHLNGIFAFGIWDEAKQQLMIARDQLGVKPLFYIQQGSALLFASEPKALLAHPLVNAELDEEGLTHLLCRTPLHVPGFVLFHNMFEVLPGHAMLFTPEQTRTIQYWCLESAPHTDDLDTTVERVRALLADTIKRQLIADVPVVSLLSGGLDSSGLTALAAREFAAEGRQLNTYSVDFVDSADNFTPTPLHVSLDAPWVQRVSEYAHTRHHTVTVGTPELIENFLVQVYAHDAPALGQLETSLYLLFRTVKQDATVAISGESADEVFGGYPWFRDENVMKMRTFPWLAGIIAADQHNRPSWLTAEANARIQPAAYIQRRYQEAMAEVPRLAGESELDAKRRELFYVNITRWMPMLLDRKDRMSMMHGLEVRVPFCDHRLVEYLWNVPWEMKMVDNIEKGLLRRAFSDVLPDDVRNRRKSAFPTSQHPAYAAGMAQMALEMLDDPNAPILPFLNIPHIRELATQGRAEGQIGFEGALFEGMVQINAWLKEYQVHIL